MRVLALRDDISFAFEGLWLRVGELTDDLVDRAEDLRDEIAVRREMVDVPAWVPVLVAAAVVLGALYLIQGSGEDPVVPATETAARPAPVDEVAAPPPAPAPPADSAAVGNATLIERPGFSLALPDGWREVDPADGASFAAVSADGQADATLSITEAPKLSFARFEEQSLAQLSQLAPDARVISRSEGPTPETTIVELAAGSEGASADAPYRVTLRAGGPYRYYFATSLRPDAPAELVGDTELLRGTLRPEVAAEGLRLP